MKFNYLIIPLVTIFVAVAGSYLTGTGLASWYGSIKKPVWTPPGAVIGAVWTVIFILTAISALLVWNSAGPKSRFGLIAGLFLFNAALNIIWSFLFFRLHLIGPAAWEAAALGASVIALIGLCWPISRLASVLLMPYAAWVAFATYLTAVVWKMNG